MALKLNKNLYNTDSLMRLIKLLIFLLMAKSNLSYAKSQSNSIFPIYATQILDPERAILDKDEIKKEADKLNYEEKEIKSKAQNQPVKPRQYNLYKAPQSSFKINQSVIYSIAFIVLLIIVILVVFQLGKQNLKTNTESLILVDAETNPQNLSQFKLNEVLSDALNKQNYKLAVRLLYLHLLKTLMEKELISPSAEKTNFDYVRELKGNKIQNAFFNTTKTFETIWYGDAEINNVVYQKISQSFTKIEAEIQLKR